MSDGVTKATRELFAAGSGDISNIDSLRARFYRRQQEQDWLEVESEDEDDKKSPKPAEEESSIDPLDQFMNTLSSSVQQAEANGVTGKRKGELVGDESEDSSEGLYEHLQKRRKAAIEGDAAANLDEAPTSEVAANLQQMMRNIINRPSNPYRTVPPKGRVQSKSEYEEEEDDDDGEDAGHSSIPANFDWDSMMSQRARPSTLSEIPKSCYLESPDVSKMEFDQIAKFRKDFRISTSGLNVPKCFTSYTHIIPSLKTQFQAVEFGMITLLEQKQRTRIAPDAFESQYLPCALSGRNLMVTIPPPSDDKNVMSVPTGDGSMESICTTLLIHAYSVIARVHVMQRQAQLNSWLRRPLVLFVTSIERDALSLAKQLKMLNAQTGVVSNMKPKVTHIKNNDDSSDIVVGSAKALVAAFASDDLSLEDIYLIIFCDIGGGLRFESELGQVLIQQARDDCQKVIITSTIDPQVDAFVKQYLQRAIRFGIEYEDYVIRDTQKVEFRFLNIPEQANRYNWLAQTLPKFKPYGNVLIFCNDESRVNDLFHLLVDEDKDIQALYIMDCLEPTRLQTLREAPILVTTINAALKLLRLKYYAAVINYDCPISAYEFGRRMIFADPIGLTVKDDSKARVYTLLSPCAKTAAYIAEAFTRKFGRKNVPHALDEQALKYAPFRKAMLSCESLPPERPSIMKGNYFGPPRAVGETKAATNKKSVPLKGSVQFIKAPPPPPQATTIQVLPKPPPSKSSPTVSADTPATRTAPDNGDASSSDDEDASAQSAPTGVSSILDTARLRARREANLAKYKAAKLAEQLSKKEDLTAEERAQLQTSAKLAQVSQIAASILAKRTQQQQL